MAIIYSYPLNQNILATDIIVGTTTAVVNGRPKNQTKSFEVVDLATFINAGNTLDSVLHNGNTSFLDAKIGSLGLYDTTEQDYAKVTINDSEYNFYNAFNTLISVLTNNSLVLYPGSYTGQLLVPNTITANRLYTFPNQSGTVALTSDIPSVTGYVPYTGATQAVNLGAYNLTVNDVVVGRGSSITNSNVVVGSNNAGYVLVSGPANSFFGSNTGKFTTSGSYNTFIGQAAGYTNDTGSYNTAVGSNAIQNNISGSYNSTFGLSSNRGNTTGIGNATFGSYSSYSNTTGNYNSHLGYGTGYYITSGNNNVFLGLYAGRSLASGSYTTISNSSIFIGANSTSFLDNQTNQIVIGDSAIGAGSNTVTLGNTSITTTRLRGTVQGGSFVKDGGTNIQYLMADGSVSTLSGSFVPYTGAVSSVDLGVYNISANAHFNGFTSVAASGTLITLTINSTPVYYITGSGGQTIKLPVATTLQKGTTFSFNNNQSSGAILVNNNSNTLVKSVPSGGYLNLVLTDNTTATGLWDAHFQAPSNVSWSTNTLDYVGSITGATWNGNVVETNRGGTGTSSAPVQGGIIYGNSTSSMASSTAGTIGQVLTSGGFSAPTWNTPAISYKYNSIGTWTSTGTLATVNLLTIPIPANSFSTTDSLNIRNIMFSHSGTVLAGVQIKVWKNSVNNFATATQIANYSFGAGANLYGQLSRIFSLQGGLMQGYPQTPSSATGTASSSTALLSTTFDTTIINYLFISAQLNDVTDTVILRNVNITN